ncbi:MAG: arginine repressor [Clostridia bacterium]|nr:arginine repressor [Clostridia bacterium]
MARNSRHNKILEIISNNEIETQEELVVALKNAKFDVTQATISRDIKELGLIKILTEDKKYKYATASSSQTISDKMKSILKSCVISITTACNMNVVKVMKSTASFVASIIEQYGISQILGITYGEDTVLLVSLNIDDAILVKEKLNSLF